ncbi:MAG: flavodoxin family protein [Candidatus Kerfeldbacteria bacterium]|nr:flavodoxin family protein [Candidatus Kerfeldbacteria bacterium]
MDVLFVYATNSSGTRLAAELAGSVLRAKKHAVTLKRANGVDPKELKKYDLVILGSCTWERFENKQKLEGQLQQHMYELQQKLYDQNLLLPGRKFAIFALGDDSYTNFAAAADHLVSLISDLGGEIVGQPLKINGWFFHPDENEQKLRVWTEKLATLSARA